MWACGSALPSLHLLVANDDRRKHVSVDRWAGDFLARAGPETQEMKQKSIDEPLTKQKMNGTKKAGNTQERKRKGGDDSERGAGVPADRVASGSRGTGGRPGISSQPLAAAWFARTHAQMQR